MRLRVHHRPQPPRLLDLSALGRGRALACEARATDPGRQSGSAEESPDWGGGDKECR